LATGNKADYLARHKADYTARHKAHRKPARTRFARHLPAVAVGAPAMTAAVAVAGVAGLAATAFALSSQPSVHSGGNPATPTSASSAPATRSAKFKPGVALPTARAATSHRAATSVSRHSPSAKPHATLDADKKDADKKTVWFTVQSGESLASISAQVYGSVDDWPVLYYANQSSIASPGSISAGQVLRVPALPAKIPAAPAIATSTASANPGTGEGTSTSTSTPTASQSDTTVNASDYSGFQACVIERESGGNAQIMNSSGHYGLYQFSYATWVAYGGVPSEFGDATVAEQNQVFENAMAAGGEDNWAPYDGC